jgi:diguanylate cyclase (GGDEF)-like protein/PAS domain S-box-containing protein
MMDRVKPRILIAEDEVIVAMDIQMRLEGAGYQVVASVVSGEEAIRKALKAQPDLALMDIGLKGSLDGIAAAEEIHRQLDIPVVYLTSYSNRSTLERAKLTEAYGYLLKPFEERTLLSTIEVALHKHKLDREVRQREEHFRRLIENISDLIVVVDHQAYVTYASPTATSILGYPSEQFIGSKFCDVCHKDDLPLLHQICEAFEQGVESTPTVEHRLRKADGSWMTVRTAGRHMEGPEGGYLILTSHDVTEAKAALEALRLSEERFRGIVERNFDAIINLDLEGKITYASPAAERLSGYPANELVGKPYTSFLQEPELSKTAPIYDKTLLGETVESIELVVPRKDGGLVYVEANSLPIFENGDAIGVQGIFRDITARKKAELELQYMATHDYLTNLPNVRLFLEHLDKAIARARRNELLVALLYLDLDGFKQVNDTFGHSTGDLVLRLAARRLEDNIRKADIVCRLGGDEFAILMTDLQCISNIDILAARLNQAMQLPFEVKNTTANITVSIGISVFPRDTRDGEELIKYADRAMYTSKALGKNRFSHFSKQ